MALRCLNASGADPGGEIVEVHDPETHLIPLVIDAALSSRPPVKIFGTDYPTPDGTAIRDYIHVVDLADTHLRALEYLLEGGQSTAFSLGTGHGSSVREVIAAVERVGGCNVPAEEAPRRAGDPPALVADPTRARKLLGWEAQYKQINQIVETAWRFAEARRH